MENVVSLEIAEADFDRFCTFARIKKDRKRSTLNKADFDEQRDYMIEEIMDGRISIDEDGKPTVHTESTDIPKVTFIRRPSMAMIKAMDSHKMGQDVAKNMAVISAAVNVAAGRLYALDYVDGRNVQVVFGMFLAE